MHVTTEVVAVLVVHPGLPSPQEQQQALVGAGHEPTTVRTIAPMTAEDWRAQVDRALAGIEPGTVLAVSNLVALGLTPDVLLRSLAEVQARGLGLVVPGLDVEAATLLRVAQALAQAVDEGCDVRTRGLLASARGADAATPPKARAVPLESYERVLAP